jgi:hypothetical protein
VAIAPHPRRGLLGEVARLAMHPQVLSLTSLPESSARIHFPRLLRPWRAPLRGCLRPEDPRRCGGGSTRRPVSLRRKLRRAERQRADGGRSRSRGDPSASKGPLPQAALRSRMPLFGGGHRPRSAPRHRKARTETGRPLIHLRDAGEECLRTSEGITCRPTPPCGSHWKAWPLYGRRSSCAGRLSIRPVQ